VDFARITEFIGNHPILIIAFLGTLGALLYTEIGRRFGGSKAVGPAEATRLSNREDAVFLDIRDDGEYQGGHIPQAIHIPLKQLPDRVAELHRFKTGPVIAYCRSGTRTSVVSGILRKHGFENVYNLSGGITAWQNANLPITTK
jgi:rhodanese-related sulfurtransferase